MKRKAAGVREAWPARPGRPGRGSGTLCVLRDLAAQPQLGEADRVDQVARLDAGPEAGAGAAGGVVLVEGGMALRRAQELVYFGQRVRQAGQPGDVAAAGHDAAPGVVP